MTQKYRIVGYQLIAVSELAPHPMALIPMDKEDTCALQDSIADHGIYQPLLVTHLVDTATSKRLILDGVNRWISAGGNASQSGTQEIRKEDQLLPCLLVECDEPRTLVLECLARRRKCTTGQRVMAYLEQHRKEVLQMAEIVAEGQGNLKRGDSRVSHVRGRENIGKLADFTAERIAEKLGVSPQDVALGIELLKAAAAEDLDGKEAEILDGIRLRILSGSAPIRRWKAAKAGATNCQRPAQYDEMAPRVAVSLVNIFRALPHLEWKIEQNREAWDMHIATAFEVAPDSIRALQSKVILDKWPVAELRRLEKEIGFALKKRKES